MPHAAPATGVHTPAIGHARRPQAGHFPLAAPRQAAGAPSMDAPHTGLCQGTGTPNGTPGKETVTRK
jgi:hypothetical protein